MIFGGSFSNVTAHVASWRWCVLQGVGVSRGAGGGQDAVPTFPGLLPPTSVPPATEHQGRVKQWPREESTREVCTANVGRLHYHNN